MPYPDHDFDPKAAARVAWEVHVLNEAERVELISKDGVLSVEEKAELARLTTRSIKSAKEFIDARRRMSSEYGENIFGDAPVQETYGGEAHIDGAPGMDDSGEGDLSGGFEEYKQARTPSVGSPNQITPLPPRK